MRKLHKTAVVASALAGVGFLGAGTAYADGGPGGDIGVTQRVSGKSYDLNLDVLGEVGIGNGLAGNALNGEGNPGGQVTPLGSTTGQPNNAFGR
ncbi:hypothetical protein NGB36_12160 [Streptomyces sp. RB6PN25]|uniref:Secreted protein n=1 Tax=Streptomyces humicola TaxID=2953240 RepID=A0ABT1PUI5_9ACTN|nr:hypothetical protein [Streptomyces humicola]MCQ4081332.1 hypothetical protein [Streptomyces humicola]